MTFYPCLVKTIKLNECIHDRFKVMAVGVNCVNPKDVTSLLKLMNTVNHWSAWPNVFNYEKVPYVVYPNAGSIDDWDHVNKRWAKDGEISDIIENVKVILGQRDSKKCNKE
jgi:S-methylmethionine-dependent homocysteine/selenocysteine methylase